PSHAAGRADLVPAISMGAVAAGAHGLIVEVHHDPTAALVDGDQSLDLAAAATMLDQVELIARASGRTLDRSLREVAA
ncbi:MAG: 3-deoxy-7-phosphoheptulonate synthase, partial [Thermoleophilia bacterium]|nr:3-deoxy-7-phosphoheptulonate synthase [Thermoleophilia bacterium]